MELWDYKTRRDYVLQNIINLNIRKSYFRLVTISCYLGLINGESTEVQMKIFIGRLLLKGQIICWQGTATCLHTKRDNDLLTSFLADWYESGGSWSKVEKEGWGATLISKSRKVLFLSYNLQNCPSYVIKQQGIVQYHACVLNDVMRKEDACVWTNFIDTSCENCLLIISFIHY